MKTFPFLQDVILDLQKELPHYLAAAEGVSADLEILQGWEKQEEKLAQWSAACQQVLLCQPSSAAVERVFSTLKNSFGDQPGRALEGYVELSLMLQHNKR